MSTPDPDAPSIELDGRVIGRGRAVFVIAEIGTAHGGDLASAKRLVDAAADAGADCAKFQAVYAREIIHPNTGNVLLPGGSTPLYRKFEEVERDADFYAAIKEYTELHGLVFMCSVFGAESARIIGEIDTRIFKIASPELNFDDLLKQVAAFGRPVILSSGVSLLGDIEHALGLLTRRQVGLLHCVTAYPAPPEDYNLRVLAPLEALFGVPVGVSDHSLDPEVVPALAVSAGASMVEKHITLSHASGGLDDPIALRPADFRVMVDAVRRAEKEAPGETIERIARGRPPGLVPATLGNGIKRLAPSETANYGATNRSIHAVTAVRAGTVLRVDHLAILRTEKNLRAGLPPQLLPAILGRRTQRDIPAGEGVVWDDLLSP